MLFFLFVQNHESRESQEWSSLSPTLRSQDTKILSRVSCRRHLGHAFGLLLNTKHLCTENELGQGMCGDVGSPLITQNKEIVGIASWRSMACGMGYPDVYTRVFTHLNWIWSNLVD